MTNNQLTPTRRGAPACAPILEGRKPSLFQRIMEPPYEFIPSYLCPKCGEWHWGDKCAKSYNVLYKYDFYEKDEDSEDDFEIKEIRAFSFEHAAEKYVEKYRNKDGKMKHGDSKIVQVEKDGEIRKFNVVVSTKPFYFTTDFIL